MTRLSIVVACFDRTDLLEETLIGVLQNRPRNCEVLVVHDGRYQDPYDLKDEVRFIKVEQSTGWVDSLNAGLDQAVGEIVHLLGAGVLPQTDWTESALAQFDDQAIGSVTPLLLDSTDARGRAYPKVRCLGVKVGGLLGRKLVAAGREYRRERLARLQPLGPNLVAAFYRREALEHCGGIVADFGDEYADIDVARRLEEAGYENTVDVDCVLNVNDFDRPRRSFVAEGRHQQHFIETCTEVAPWRRRLATWGQSAIDCLTSPLDPRRLATLWGRLTATRLSEQEQESDTGPEILALPQRETPALDQPSTDVDRRRAA